MNIFFLHKSPMVAAKYQETKSATKMVLETAQLLSTCVRYYGYKGKDVYRSSYVNHPSNKWARRSRAHFDWLVKHGLALSGRYSKTFGKTHKSHQIIVRCGELSSLLPNRKWSIRSSDLAIKSTDFGLAALEAFKRSSMEFKDAVHAYRWFYAHKRYVSARKRLLLLRKPTTKKWCNKYNVSDKTIKNFA